MVSVCLATGRWSRDESCTAVCQVHHINGKLMHEVPFLEIFSVWTFCRIDACLMQNDQETISRCFLGTCGWFCVLIYIYFRWWIFITKCCTACNKFPWFFLSWRSDYVYILHYNQLHFFCLFHKIRQHMIISLRVGSVIYFSPYLYVTTREACSGNDLPGVHCSHLHFRMNYSNLIPSLSIIAPSSAQMFKLMLNYLQN